MAWGSLLECLDLRPSDTLLVRGGTCALGYAAIQIAKALELVGPKTLSDTLRCMEKGGIVCNTGILGGVYTLNGFDPIKFIPNGVYLTGFHSNWPTKQVMDDIFAFIDRNKLKPCIGASYGFGDIREACMALDEGKVNGKIVVEMAV